MPIRHARSGFTLVELIVVLVIGAVILAAIHRTIINQERAYRYNNAAMSAQRTTRTALHVISSELRPLSASAGTDAARTSGADLLAADAHSIKFRAFRKVGIVCDVPVTGTWIDAWALGDAFAKGDSLLFFVENQPSSREDDAWVATRLTGTGTVNLSSCETDWPEYQAMALNDVGNTVLDNVIDGAPIRSFETLTYSIVEYDGDWVLARQEPGKDPIPLIGPLRSPEQDGLRFRYFDEDDIELTSTPLSSGDRAAVDRIQIGVRGLSAGQGTNNSDHVDTLVTSVYLRGN